MQRLPEGVDPEGQLPPGLFGGVLGMLGQFAALPPGAAEPSGQSGVLPLQPFGASASNGFEGQDAGTIARPWAEASVNFTSTEENGFGE